MKMTEYIERLQNLDDMKLIDVVKNYRQYGYDHQLRETAISILNERGITREKLRLNGTFENKKYDYAQELYNSFGKNSRASFFLYGVILVTIILVPILTPSFEYVGLFTLAVNWISIIFYLIFLIRSFINQTMFYRSLDKDYGTEGALIYLFLGMPFYIIMYFYFRDHMKEKIKEIT